MTVAHNPSLCAGIIATVRTILEADGAIIGVSRQTLAELADQIEAAGLRIVELDTECDEIEAKWAREVDRARELTAERDALRADLAAASAERASYRESCVELQGEAEALAEEVARLRAESAVRAP